MVHVYVGCAGIHTFFLFIFWGGAIVGYVVQRCMGCETAGHELDIFFFCGGPGGVRSNFGGPPPFCRSVGVHVTQWLQLLL